jgi:ankyrin repeat protein
MSTGSGLHFETEVNSAHPALAPLLRLLDNPMSSVTDIGSEILSVAGTNPDLVKDYVVPASGLPVLFYVARRLSNCTKSETLSGDTIELFEILIHKCGASVNMLDLVMRQNVLFYVAKAGDLEVCKYLAFEGCQSNLADIHNQTALFYAAREGMVDVVEWLVKTAGCNINHIDRNGQTALLYAARENRFECVKMMVNSLGADPLVRDVYKKRIISYLKSVTHKDTFDFLSDFEKGRDSSSGSTQRKSLTGAQAVGNTDSEAGINSAHAALIPLLRLLEIPDSSEEDIKTELMGFDSSHSSLLKDYFIPASGIPVMFYVARRLANRARSGPTVELLRMLIHNFGADVNMIDLTMKQNVMFYASKVGDLECCKFLLSEGCQPDRPDVHHQTPLFYAAREGQTAVVEWLVSSVGCDINHIDRNGQTALFYAAREDRFECVMMMVNTLGADPLIRDVHKKRARVYLKSGSQRRTHDFLTEIEKARDPAFHASNRKMFVVRDEPLGAAAMTLRQHKPYNPYLKEEEELVVAPAPPKRQKSGASTPTPTAKPVKEKIEKSEAPSRATRSERSSVAPSTAQSPSEASVAPPGRSRFRVRAPLGQGGLDAFEKEFPQFALWTPTSGQPVPSPTTPPKTLNRPPRAAPVGTTPAWVSVVSLLLRGPLWRYGPASIFHKPVFQLPALLPKEFHDETPGPEKKLTIDLSLIRKKLEKGKYQKMTEVDKDIRSMFQQGYDLAGGPDTNLALLTRATEMYYDQQIAGCGLARIIREESTSLEKPAPEIP